MEGSSPTSPPTIKRAGRVQVSVGFMPLVDCAPIVIAAEKGFAAAHDLRLNLVRETSWANIRDRTMLGHFDAAHMLGPLPIASTLGAGGHFQTPMIAPFSLGFGGNAITVSTALWGQLRSFGANHGDSPKEIAIALARSIAERRGTGSGPLTIAMVYPFSGHNYELRYWLAAAGINPDSDVRLVVLPPPFMADALREGQVDAFCVGEPWNSLAVEGGDGVIVVSKSELWRQGPEKVLGLHARFAEKSASSLTALLRSLHEASAWAADPANFDEVSDILERPNYVGTPAPIIRRSISGAMVSEKGREPVFMPDFLGFHDHAANFPWQSHALWYYTQMVRWGQIAHDPATAETARRVYRPDLYRDALSGVGADLPNASSKVEGALRKPTPVASRSGRLVLGPDGFFDDVPFDPADIEGYLGQMGVNV